MARKILTIMAIFVIVATTQGSDLVHFQQGEENNGFITSWSEKPDTKIERFKDDSGNEIVKLRSDSPNGYLTPMIHLKPIKITNKTVLSFQMKCPVLGVYSINLTNAAEDAWYRLRFEAKANEWVTFRQYISGSSFKRNLINKGVINDGMMGDPLTKVQIEAKGNEVLLKNFKIYESEKIVEELPKIIPISRDNYKLSKYPRFNRGGFFPFGVISTVKAANEKNGKYFSQSLEERREQDLLSIRRLNFNTYCNFIDETFSVAERLKAMEHFDLYLMETATAYLDYLNNNARAQELVKKYDSNDRLLAWYGRDEPQNLEAYLDWKITMDKNSPNKPYTSAFDGAYKIKMLGPSMEVVMPDVYPLTVTCKTPARDIVNKTGGIIRLSKECGGNGKVWSIHQAYSLRRKQENKSFYSLRYPNHVEIRFDFFNALAAGSEGIIYFILNDQVPFLDGEIRREEFDKTLLDPWYNTNTTTKELAKLGRNFVPVAASIMGAKEISPYKYSASDKIVSRTTENEFGTYYYIVNANLKDNKSLNFDPKRSAEEICVNLMSGKKLDKGQVTLLGPGMGAVFMVGTPENVNRITSEITDRKLRNTLNLAEVENRVLAKAGQQQISLNKDAISDAIKQKDWATANTMINKYFNELNEFHKGKSDYAIAGRKLTSIRKQFGEIFNRLIKPEMIEKYDGKVNQKFQAQFDKIKDFSKEYFALYRKWANGKTYKIENLDTLNTKVSQLLEEIKRLRSNTNNTAIH